MFRMPRVFAGLLAIAFLFVAASGVPADTLSQIATQVGADTFYGMGYDGDGVIIGNVEAGHVRNDHEALPATTVTERKGWTGVGGVTFSVQSHATRVGGVLAGQDNTTTGPGMAHGAELWSGQIATSITGSSFTISGNSLLYPLMLFGAKGISGETADVINSSWGGSNNDGNSVINVLYDYLANAMGVTMVASAGNAGAGAGTVGTPANGWNVIAVGATSGTGTDEEVTGFSSSGPSSDFFTQSGMRTKPDIVAPGLNFLMPRTGASNAYTTSSGTSFSAPTVAGGVALVQDYGKDTGRSTDPRLMKAVLLNSARKLAGWSQDVDTHPTTSTRINFTPLDDGQGAGTLDLAAAFTQYSATSATGTGATSVGGTGWDLNTVSESTPNDYLIDQVLDAGTTITATLVWFMDRTVSGYNFAVENPFPGTTFVNDSFDDLDLLLFAADISGLATGEAIAASISGWDSGDPDALAAGADSVEQLYFDVPTEGRYVLRVRWTQELFDEGTDAQSESYAVAWNVPEPATLGILLVGSCLLRIPRRRKQA